MKKDIDFVGLTNVIRDEVMEAVDDLEGWVNEAQRLESATVVLPSYSSTRGHVGKELTKAYEEVRNARGRIRNAMVQLGGLAEKWQEEHSK